MTNLRGSRFAEIMPENLGKIPEVQAISYAVGRQVEKICTLIRRVGIYANVNNLPENILDYLAVELRTPAYSQDYPISTKRALVQDTLLFYEQMGTVAAVERIAQVIFGSGTVYEWFDYGGAAGHFKVETTNPAITAGNVAEFQEVLSTVKRLSAWLDEILLSLATDTAEIYAGAWLHEGEVVRLQPARV